MGCGGSGRSPARGEAEVWEESASKDAPWSSCKGRNPCSKSSNRNAGRAPTTEAFGRWVSKGRAEILPFGQGVQGAMKCRPGHGGVGGSRNAPTTGSAAARRLRVIKRRYVLLVR